MEPVYKDMYYRLFNTISDVLERLEDAKKQSEKTYVVIPDIMEILTDAQKVTEEMYLDAENKDGKTATVFTLIQNGRAPEHNILQTD